jgi:hypothetical protein
VPCSWKSKNLENEGFFGPIAGFFARSKQLAVSTCVLTCDSTWIRCLRCHDQNSDNKSPLPNRLPKDYLLSPPFPLPLPLPKNFSLPIPFGCEKATPANAHLTAAPGVLSRVTPLSTNRAQRCFTLVIKWVGMSYVARRCSLSSEYILGFI